MCLVTHQINGPTAGSDVGAYNEALAGTLVRAGHDVTILYTGTDFACGIFENWRDDFQQRGITFHQLSTVPGRWKPHPRVVRSYLAYEWLRAHRFDTIHFTDRDGDGYYSLVAKRLGLDFADTGLCVSAFGPVKWVRDGRSDERAGPAELFRDFLQKRSLELADTALIMSEEVFERTFARGWALPRVTFHMPHPLPSSASE